jgi:hypothetical protein
MREHEAVQDGNIRKEILLMVILDWDGGWI